MGTSWGAGIPCSPEGEKIFMAYTELEQFLGRGEEKVRRSA